jgi:hypothetical protein
LAKKLKDEEVVKLEGEFLDESSYDLIIRESVSAVKKETGEPLLVFIKNAIAPHLVSQGYNALKIFAKPDDNRGAAAGKIEKSKIRKSRQRLKIVKSSAYRYSPILDNGTQSRNSYSNIANSGIFGYFEETPRFPYCRQTAITMKNPDNYINALPYIKSVNDIFKQYVPDRYKNQLDYVKRTSKDFLVHGTVFSTLTINKNFRTAVHTDKGDLHEGFSCLSVARRLNYIGGFLVFPQYRIAVDIYEGDVILMDAHEWHGNSPIKPVGENHERLAVVFYYRTEMEHCGTQEEELAKARKGSESKIQKDKTL